jgi:hypothetical protein
VYYSYFMLVKGVRENSGDKNSSKLKKHLKHVRTVRSIEHFHSHISISISHNNSLITARIFFYWQLQLNLI